MNQIFSAVLLGGALLAAPAAFADESRDTLRKAEAQIEALDSADAAMAASVDHQETLLRLQEARDAEAKGDVEESIWRSQEAALHGEVVQEKSSSTPSNVPLRKSRPASKRFAANSSHKTDPHHGTLSENHGRHCGAYHGSCQVRLGAGTQRTPAHRRTVADGGPR
jgi:hypothetical protein